MGSQGVIQNWVTFTFKSSYISGKWVFCHMSQMCLSSFFWLVSGIVSMQKASCFFHVCLFVFLNIWRVNEIQLVFPVADPRMRFHVQVIREGRFFRKKPLREKSHRRKGMNLRKGAASCKVLQEAALAWPCQGYMQGLQEAKPHWMGEREEGSTVNLGEGIHNRQ